MNDTKEKKSKLQIVISILTLTVILFAEIYFMINFKESYVAIILLAVIALAAVYIMINAYMTLNEIKEAKRNEHLENLYKSDKASYMMLKKSFTEIEEKLITLQEISKLPGEEIINAQKGTAKVIINRSKENADAMINSNNQVLEKLNNIEETLSTKFDNLSKEQESKFADVVAQTEMKMKDLIVQLKDAELRLNQAIMSETKVVMSSPVTYAPVESVSVKPVMEEVSVAEEMPVVEEVSVTEEMPVVEEISVAEEIPVVEEMPVVEEVPPMPDMSDPNKAMSPDDIAALFANLAPAEEAVAEPEPIMEPVVEEKPPMPDLSDPNKVMTPDEIAALLANL